ncbi:hypothetical protein CA13_61860 [Planctomycetes bacterium CA13]|uniref:Uncharacterized protein n=1 Tax=Novipirellula herctigrandis TaxID=2527986 RepID=A0A5C5ZC34_9BACT|nr:hypothetical protein CA13_61860 [Planctomycetes bacterium CA13]
MRTPSHRDLTSILLASLRLTVRNQRKGKRTTMPNQFRFVRQAAAFLIACGLIASLMTCFAGALYAQTVDPKSVLGDTTIPSPEDVSQTFPYGITGKTPPSLTKINYEGQESYHKHRINLRIFQGCPQIEIAGSAVRTGVPRTYRDVKAAPSTICERWHR